MNERYAREVLSGRRRTVLARLLVAALVPFSLLYAAVMKIRRALYKRNILQVHRLDRPVISVGNITAGGTGKTPMVALISRWYVERGMRIAVLSRGYGGSAEGAPRVVSDGTTTFCSAEEAGDEPVLLAQMVPGLMVVTGRNRYEAGCLAREQLNPDLFILDDGFQHLRLHRDLDIVLLDARRPFGNGFVLPAGLMREQYSALVDADVVVRTRSAGEPAPVRLKGNPELHAAYRLAGIRRVVAGAIVPELLPFTLLAGQSGVAVAGIAEPEPFFAMAEEAGCVLTSRLAFRDHAPYGENETARILAEVQATGASYVVTTEKDAVKLQRLADVQSVAVFATVLEMPVTGAHCLDAELSRFLRGPA